MMAIEEESVVKKPMPDVSCGPTANASEGSQRPSSDILFAENSSVVNTITDDNVVTKGSDNAVVTDIDTAPIIKEGMCSTSSPNDIEGTSSYKASITNIDRTSTPIRDSCLVSSLNDSEGSDKALVTNTDTTTAATTMEGGSVSSPNTTYSAEGTNVSAPSLDVSTAMNTNAEGRTFIENPGRNTHESSVNQLSNLNSRLGDTEESENSATISSLNSSISVSSHLPDDNPASSAKSCISSLTATNQTSDISVAQKNMSNSSSASISQDSTSSMQNLTTTSSQLAMSHCPAAVDATASAEVLSPNPALTPGTFYQDNRSSTSPSKALSSLVGYGTSSDSDDDSMDTNVDAHIASPSTTDVVEMQVESAADQDVIVEPVPSNLTNGHCNVTTTKENTKSTSELPIIESKCSDITTTKENTSELPMIDLTSDNYRYTIDIGSGTDDSESDSEGSSSSSSSSDETTTSSSSSSESEESSSEGIEKKEIQQTKKYRSDSEKTSSKKKRNNLLTPGELSIDDLPPIEDLKISVSEDQAHVIGFVLNIVDRQVVVQGHHGIPPIDLDSVLFLDIGKRVLGQIFDVFGHVQEPLYVVRFNSADHVKEHEINKGDLVFYAPSTEHTSFVVIDALMRMKGSDASGLTGNEPLSNEVTDFSDDEEEASVKGHTKQSKYNSSTNEFQSSRKRSRNQGHHSNGENRGGGKARGAGRACNPFSERGMRPRPRNHFGQTKFDPRYPHGPSQFPVGPPGKMQGPPVMMDNGDFNSGQFSPFTSQVEMNCSSGQAYQNGYPLSTSPWSQPPPSQFGGPPQFPNQRPCFPPPPCVSMPPSTPPPCPTSFSPRPPHHPSVDFQNMGPPAQSCPPSFSPRPPYHPSLDYQNVGPSPPPCPSSFSPGPPHHPSFGFQNMGNATPPPYAQSFSPRPPHLSTGGFQNMGPPPPVDHSGHPPAGSVNGGWCPPGPASPAPSSPYAVSPRFPSLLPPAPPSSPHSKPPHSVYRF